MTTAIEFRNYFAGPGLFLPNSGANHALQRAALSHTLVYSKSNQINEFFFQKRKNYEFFNFCVKSLKIYLKNHSS